jgi:hypothetical protein
MTDVPFALKMEAPGVPGMIMILCTHANFHEPDGDASRFSPHKFLVAVPPRSAQAQYGNYSTPRSNKIERDRKALHFHSVVCVPVQAALM